MNHIQHLEVLGLESPFDWQNLMAEPSDLLIPFIDIFHNFIDNKHRIDLLELVVDLDENYTLIIMN